MSNDSELAIERKGHVAPLTLNAPERRNALTQSMVEGLAAIWPESDAGPVIRAVVLTGSGRGFCSGAHAGGLATAASMDEQPASCPRFTVGHLNFYKPVITAVMTGL